LAIKKPIKTFIIKAKIETTTKNIGSENLMLPPSIRIIVFHTIPRRERLGVARKGILGREPHG
jgi:hypothetical protein